MVAEKRSGTSQEAETLEAMVNKKKKNKYTLPCLEYFFWLGFVSRERELLLRPSPLFASS